MHPDALILTGDNTNSGDEASARDLVKKLTKVKDSGIPVILTTGNHDFDRMNMEKYREIYGSLVNADDADTASLSYAVIIGRTAVLAMDDNSYTGGQMGVFSPETLQWLQDMLDKYADYEILFLSHHNVTLDLGDDGGLSYRIQNAALADILDASDFSDKEKEEIQDLTKKFFLWYTDGTLGSHAKELLNNPVYPEMIHAYWDYNYGPWMQAIAESGLLDATSLEVTLK